ncbi:hypothetical protein FQR65_LT20255 [Abscondita terminalis]|nr:hypothetical protein FQR65_LT20255 [Abscondita terminalis]
MNQPSTMNFESWARAEYLTSESCGIRSDHRCYQLSARAWEAGQSAILRTAGSLKTANTFLEFPSVATWTQTHGRVTRKISAAWPLSQNSNENEAPRRQAQSVCAEYALTEMDVRLSDVGEVESEMSRAKRRPTWDRHLGSVVGEAFGVRSFSSRRWCTATSRVVEREMYVRDKPGPQIAIVMPTQCFWRPGVLHLESWMRNYMSHSQYSHDQADAWLAEARKSPGSQAKRKAWRPPRAALAEWDEAVDKQAAPFSAARPVSSFSQPVRTHLSTRSSLHRAGKESRPMPDSADQAKAVLTDAEGKPVIKSKTKAPMVGWLTGIHQPQSRLAQGIPMPKKPNTTLNNRSMPAIGWRRNSYV